jgi:hypothetical protein
MREAVPNRYLLSENEVHVWLTSLGESDGCGQPFSQILSDDDRRKADRFRFLVDCQRHVISRVLVRTLLAALPSS